MYELIMNFLKILFDPFGYGYDKGYEQGINEMGAYRRGYYDNERYLDKSIDYLMMALNMDIEDKELKTLVRRTVVNSADYIKLNEVVNENN